MHRLFFLAFFSIVRCGTGVGHPSPNKAVSLVADQGVPR